MPSEVHSRSIQSGPTAGWPGHSNQGGAFPGFQPLTANFTQSPNEIVDLKMPGLTSDLRYTMLVLARDTIGEAYARGGSPYEFNAISWPRWMELLDLQSVNAVKARLARLEEMGLIEIQPGQKGAWGTTAFRFRLRWVNDGRPASRVFQAVLRNRTRPISREQQGRPWGHPPTDTPADQSTDAPTDQPTDTSTDHSADNPTDQFTEKIPSTCTKIPNQSASPSILNPNGLTDRLTDYNFEINNKNNQSASPSLPPENRTAKSTDGMTERISILNSNLKTWLKPVDPEPWPEPLLLGLSELLDPPQMDGLADRSAWSAEGASAILQAIRSKGRRLCNQAGTLWNALLKPEKGAVWLAQAGPPPRQAGSVEAPGSVPLKGTGPSFAGSRHLAQEDVNPSPLAEEALERHQRLGAPSPPESCELDPYDDEDDNRPVEVPMPMHQVEKVTRAEDLSPELKAQLRALIETYREASLAARHSPAINRPGFFDACSQAWQGIGALLEPVLPLELKLTDDYLPTTIRRRAQIKMNILYPLFLAVS